MPQKIIIALDSNVFRNQNFINYLVMCKDQFEIYLPSIVQLEVGYYYLTIGLQREDFLQDLDNFDCKLNKWGLFSNDSVIQTAFSHRREFPFKHHFRDYIIGIEVDSLVEILITYNLKHFTWMKKVSCQTPEDFILTSTK